MVHGSGKYNIAVIFLFYFLFSDGFSFK